MIKNEQIKIKKAYAFTYDVEFYNYNALKLNTWYAEKKNSW